MIAGGTRCPIKDTPTRPDQYKRFQSTPRRRHSCDVDRGCVRDPCSERGQRAWHRDRVAARSPLRARPCQCRRDGSPATRGRHRCRSPRTYVVPPRRRRSRSATPDSRSCTTGDCASATSDCATVRPRPRSSGIAWTTAIVRTPAVKATLRLFGGWRGSSPMCRPGGPTDACRVALLHRMCSRPGRAVELFAQDVCVSGVATGLGEHVNQDGARRGQRAADRENDPAVGRQSPGAGWDELGRAASWVCQRSRRCSRQSWPGGSKSNPFSSKAL